MSWHKSLAEFRLRTTLESTNSPRASVDEIYTQIAADLKNAIEMMPAKIYPKGSDMTGHATKYAAEAMMHVYSFSIPDATKKRAPQRNYQRGGHLLDR